MGGYEAIPEGIVHASPHMRGRTLAIRKGSTISLRMCARESDSINGAAGSSMPARANGNAGHFRKELMKPLYERLFVQWRGGHVRVSESPTHSEA